MENNFLVCNHLQKKWDGCDVDFSCTIQKGQILALLGQSGSGKSTILQLIAGLILPDIDDKKTELIIDGKDCLNLPCSKRGIGMIFQGSSLFPHMNVLENVAYGLRCKGISKKESKELAWNFLIRVGLAGFADRLPNTLSGGEAQRVALARTLVLKPSVILFDEPFSALDKPLRKTLTIELLAMQKEYQFTGIFVTHDVDDISLLCKNVVVIKKGKTTWSGQLEDYNEDLLK